MNDKWYFNTWFIVSVFAFALVGIPVLGERALLVCVPVLIGLILLILQYLTYKTRYSAYEQLVDLDGAINSKNELLQKLSQKEVAQSNILDQKIAALEKKQQELTAEYKKELLDLETECICEEAYLFSDYDGLSSEDCKNKLALLKTEERAYVKEYQADVLDGLERKERKKYSDNVKQILRCFNSECDNILLNLSSKNIDASRGKITKSFETLNKIFDVDDIQLEQDLLEYKLEELNLVYTYELKKDQERELQRTIKEQMVEEEKVRREIEQQKAKIEKDQIQCNNEINKLMSYVQKTQSEAEKQLYIDKIRELEEKVRQLEADKTTVLEREANARAGYVYVISNIGSFGEDIYKIGMTRRLEPLDRIKELSSASVPFEFDVHAMIFSEDAPALETTLHQTFEKQSVNRVNLRKEFFKVPLEEIENVVKSKFNNTATFTKIPVAKEYNETLLILKQEMNS